MEMSMNMLAYNIENALRHKHVSYRELGRRLRRDPAAIANHLYEPHRLTVDEVIKIAAAIGVNWRVRACRKTRGKYYDGQHS